MRLAVIAGDGIGPEVVAEGLKVLREVAPDLETTPYDLGATRWSGRVSCFPTRCSRSCGARRDPAGRDR